MLKIDKKQARKAFNAGKEIRVVPCKCAPSNVWGIGASITRASGYTFDKLVNEFEHYNCNSELGNRAAYYIEGEV